MAITANSSAPPNPPIAAPSGMKVKNTSMPLSPSKLLVLKIPVQASPAPMPRAAPPNAPSTRPNSASNAIFMAVFSSIDTDIRRLVSLTCGKVQGCEEKLPEMTKEQAGSALHRIAHAGGERFGEVAAEQLLHEIEGIEERAVQQDPAAAQREEFRGFQMHDAVVVSLAQADELHGRDLVAVDGDELDLVFAVRIALLLGLDRFRHPGVAVLVPEMRKQFDRRIGDAVEFLVAARRRGRGVPGIERVEEFQHPLLVKARNHVVLRGY